MMRGLKALGVAFVASISMSAIAAGVGQAAEFHSSQAHAILNATQTTTHVLLAGNGYSPTTCDTVTFAGTSEAATQTEQMLYPYYGGCSDMLGRTVDIALNGCGYKFHATAGAEGTYTGDIDIVCPSGNDIAITATPTTFFNECKITIEEQAGVGPVAFHNIANGDVKLDLSITNIISTSSGGSLACGTKNGTHTGGPYSGDSILSSSTTEGTPINVFVG